VNRNLVVRATQRSLPPTVLNSDWEIPDADFRTPHTALLIDGVPRDSLESPRAEQVPFSISVPAVSSNGGS